MSEKKCPVCKKELIESKLLNINVCDCIRKNYTLQVAETKDGIATRLVKNDSLKKTKDGLVV